MVKVVIASDREWFHFHGVYSCQCKLVAFCRWIYTLDLDNGLTRLDTA